MAWIVRLVKIGADCEERFAHVMTINRPDDLDDIANLGLTLADGKRVLWEASNRRSVLRKPEATRFGGPFARNCSGVCHVKDYRNHAVATHLGRVMVRLPRFRCAGCGAMEAGVGWPSHCRSTPELDQLRAHLSALMPYRVAADVLEQVFPVDPERIPRRCAGTL